MAFLKTKKGDSAAVPEVPASTGSAVDSELVMVSPGAAVSSVGFGSRVYAVRTDGTFRIPFDEFENALRVGLILAD